MTSPRCLHGSHGASISGKAKGPRIAAAPRARDLQGYVPAIQSETSLIQSAGNPLADVAPACGCAECAADLAGDARRLHRVLQSMSLMRSASSLPTRTPVCRARRICWIALSRCAVPWRKVNVPGFCNSNRRCTPGARPLLLVLFVCKEVQAYPRVCSAPDLLCVPGCCHRLRPVQVKEWNSELHALLSLLGICWGCLSPRRARPQPRGMRVAVHG